MVPSDIEVGASPPTHMEAEKDVPAGSVPDIRQFLNNWSSRSFLRLKNLGDSIHISGI